ncbi:MAG: transposase [Pirellulaceae bacterium]|nr:transposase [Pirellulaceae bacterium]
MSRPQTTRPQLCYQKIHADVPDSSILDGIDDPIVLSNVSAIEAIVSQIDVTVIEECYSNRGTKSYPADVLLRIALYCILDGRPSPNQWARSAQTCSAVRYLARCLRPSRTTLHRFRDKSKSFIEDVFSHVLVLAQKDGFLDSEEASIDGTFIDALASRHRLVNQETLDKRQAKIAVKIEEDIQGTIEIEPISVPAWMAKTPGGRLEQQLRFVEANDVLTEKRKKNSKKRKSDRLNESKIFVSTSDPGVPISRNKQKVFGPLWPTQYVTHNESGLVLAAQIFANATDCGTIGTMIDLVRTNVSIDLKKLYADAGYTSTCDIRACKQRMVELIAPVNENSFTEQLLREKQNASPKPKVFARAQFVFDYDNRTCRCPNGVVATTSKDGCRFFANGESLQTYRLTFPTSTCQGCPLRSQCLPDGQSYRRLRLIEGEEDVVAHKAKMTSEVLLHCRAVRAKTAEKAFADSKTRACLERLGCKSLVRARAITLLHLLAMNLKRLYRLRQTLEKPS